MTPDDATRAAATQPALCDPLTSCRQFAGAAVARAYLAANPADDGGSVTPEHLAETDAKLKAARELREAISRLRTLWAEGGTLDAAYGVALSLEGQRAFIAIDCEVLARAWLAAASAAESVVSDLIRLAARLVRERPMDDDPAADRVMREVSAGVRAAADRLAAAMRGLS